jgi:small redox-active disulfide protein 2
MKLQIVGPGCTNCRTLAERTDVAARELGLEYELEKVEELTAIVSMGIVRTPALVIDGETKLVGRVPSVAELKEILSA